MLAIPPIPEADPLPLVDDGMGGMRFQNSRVSLDAVIESYLDGMSPEAIAKAFDTLQLADIYAVIAYYLRHRSEVDDYLSQRATLAASVEQSAKQIAKSADGHIAALRRRNPGSPLG